ncbi:MAG TPA: Gfo/Idh/MocA family oxidoreductase [Propionibacteriaceae bacterium]|nr:Gfo/Idh/MocA family oxidoreductase [Propionibacteriaceae bacterium]
MVNDRTSEELPVLGVGVVGWGWMGQVHARAYARLRQHYPDAPLSPGLVAVADNAADDRLASAIEVFGFREAHADWRDLVARDDVDVVSVTGPNFIHREVAVAAAEAGKHVWVEKPAGRNATETRSISDAVRANGVQSAVGFNYRNVPAIEMARQLIADGRLGQIKHVYIRLLADYAAHPDGALTWRFKTEWSGSGVLSDLASHGVDLGRYLVGDITDLMCHAAPFIAQRPQVGMTASHFSRGTGGPMGAVENEDYIAALLRFRGGGLGILESSRASIGEQCTYGVEVHGARGALCWDFRRMGELQLCLDQNYQNAYFRTHYVAPGDGDFARFQPAAGIAMSYDDLKIVEAHRLVQSIATGKAHGATVEDAVYAAEIIEALAESAQSRRWVTLAR